VVVLLSLDAETTHLEEVRRLRGQSTKHKRENAVMQAEQGRGRKKSLYIKRETHASGKARKERKQT